jgi:excisionase family DNA binding protein
MGMDRILARLQEERGTLTTAEVVEVVGCSRSYLYKLIAAGSVTVGRVGCDYRIPVQEARRLAREAGVITD